MHPASGVSTETLEVRDNTGWRYARVSGDFNPIHLTARTAQMFGFKQAVAHGMWSLGRCLAAAAPHLPKGKMQVDTQFKLPVYIPSQALARTWNSSDTVRDRDVHDARRSAAPGDAGAAAVSATLVDLLTAIESRASALKLIEPGPTRAHLEQIMRAGVRAPDHGRLRPWRFVVLEGAAREKLGDAMARLSLAKFPQSTPEQLDGERRKALRAPTIVVVAARITQGKIPEVEQVARGRCRRREHGAGCAGAGLRRDVEDRRSGLRCANEDDARPGCAGSHRRIPLSRNDCACGNRNASFSRRHRHLD